MERTDKSREVWQRVWNPQPAVLRDGLRVLRRESAALAAACYLYLIPLWDLAVHLRKRRLTAKAR